MCLATVLKEDDQNVIMRDTAYVLPGEKNIKLINLFGESKEVEGRLTLIDLQNNVIKIECES